MKLPVLSPIRLARAARVAIVVAALVALAGILFDRGWHLAGALVLLGAVLLVSAFYAIVVRPARIPTGAILLLAVTDGLREDSPRSPLEQLRGRGAPTLFDLRRVLEGAATDAALKAVIVEIAAPGIGLATAQELHDLMRAVGAAGKRVIALLHGDNVSVRDYLIACGAHEIVVNPDTGILMLGVAVGGLFLHDALAKLGVEAQTLQWKEYKGAGETFSRPTMSPELRESLEAIVADWNCILTNSVAAARKLSVEQAGEALSAGFISAARAVERGLADRQGYLEDLRAELAPGEADEQFVTLGRYLRHLAYTRDGAAHARLALIHALGPIVTSAPPMAGEFISGADLAADLRHAARDKQVRAIVLRVNSPGGSAVGSDLVWRAVREARERGKPVVVSMGDVAGSGGYYIAMGADVIVAEPATITGSIGVVYTKFSLPTLLERLGIAIENAKSDPVSDALSPARAMTAAELAQLNQMVGELYANFTAKVATARNLDPDAAEAVARGRVWSGLAGQAHGLVDELGGLSRAVALARDKAGLAPGELHDLVLYPAPGLLASLRLNFAQLEIPPALALAASIVELPPRWTPALVHLLLRRAGALQLCGLWPLG
jgi:protease-4